MKMKAKFMCSGKQMIGELIKSNFHTILVKVKFKEKIKEKVGDEVKETIKKYEKVIKRHKDKHAVVIVG